MLKGHGSMPSQSPQAIPHHVHVRNMRIGAANTNTASSLFSSLRGGFGPCVIEIACFWTATILCDTSKIFEASAHFAEMATPTGLGCHKGQKLSVPAAVLKFQPWTHLTHFDTMEVSLR